MAIQIRRGTNTEWESNNSNIVAGEPAIATDAERFFVGTASGDYAEFANLDIIAPAYNTSTSYVVGDITNYHGKLYSCNTPCSGAFNVSYWDEKSLAEILKDLENEINYAQYEIGYADGELIMIDNGASEIPVKDLTLDIKAAQDLHGYDHPWVGGAGKNLVYPIMHDSDGSVMNTYTSQGITYTYNSDGSVTAIGTSTAESLSGYAPSATTLAPLRFLPVGTYILSGSFGTNNVTLYAQFRDKSNNVVPVKINGSSYNAVTCRGTKTATFTVETECCAYVRADIMPGETVNGTFYPMIRKSTDSATYEPYSNICPISGWDEVNVNVRDVNIWDEEWEQGTFNNDTGMPVASTANIRSKNFIPILPNTQYYSRTGGNSWLTRLFYDSAQNFITYQSTKNGVFTTPSNACYMKFRTESVVYGDTYHNDISINYPSTDTSYHAYNGQTYTIDLDGTRYGGSLDVTTGVLTIGKVEVDLGTLGWIYTSSYNGIFYADLPSDAKLIVGTDGSICSNYVPTRGSDWQYLSNGEYILREGLHAIGRCAIVIKDNSYTDATAFKTAMSGVQLVYELATPQVVQLTPTQVRTVLGTNNLWNQMNTNNELFYRISNALN